MTKTLQKKFVRTAMTAVTLLLILLLGAINAVNLVFVNEDIDAALGMIAEAESALGGLELRPDMLPPLLEPKDGRYKGRKNEYDTILSSNYFTVRFDRAGDAVFTDVSRTSSVTEEEAVSLAAGKLQSGAESGRSGKYEYVIRDMRSGAGKCAVFLDISTEIYSCLRVALLSVAAGIACWGLMLAFVILLSKKAIKPIAENIEKQRRFVTDAGHEIKTPLAIIMSNTEAMELYNGENRWSRNIREQTARLTGLMNDLLTLARTDEGVQSGEKTVFSLSELLAFELRGFMQPMEAKRISLREDIAPDVSVTADRKQIERLVSILLDNAVKYCDEGGSAAVRLYERGGHAALEIENTCEALPGAPPEKLFDRFYRADEAHSQSTGGCGIGLSIAKSIADLNGAAIKAEYSEPPAIRFTVRF